MIMAFFLFNERHPVILISWIGFFLVFLLGWSYLTTQVLDHRNDLLILWVWLSIFSWKNECQLYLDLSSMFFFIEKYCLTSMQARIYIAYNLYLLTDIYISLIGADWCTNRLKRWFWFKCKTECLYYKLPKAWPVKLKILKE